jgi:hypothetical protein
MNEQAAVSEWQVEVLEESVLGYSVSVTLFGEEVWSERFVLHPTPEEAFACGRGFIEGMKLAYRTGYPGAANYVLGAGQWPGAQANAGNDGDPYADDGFIGADHPDAWRTP